MNNTNQSDDATTTSSSNENSTITSASSSAVIVSNFKLYHFELRATFALNNLAISMIERNCLEQAFETSKSALMCLQSVTDNDSSQKTCVRNHIRQALHHGNNPLPTNVLTVPAITIATMDELFLTHQQTIFQQQQHHSSSSSFSTNPTTMTTTTENGLEYTLLKIADSCYTALSEDLNFLTAIVLFNFAVCSLCKTRCCCDDSDDDTDESNNTTAADARSTEDDIVILYFARDLLEDAASAHKNMSDDNRSTATSTTSSFIPSSYHSNTSSCTSSSSRSSSAPSSCQNYSPPFFSLYPCIISTTVVLLQTLRRVLSEAGHTEDALACLYKLSHVRTVESVLRDAANVQRHFQLQVLRRDSICCCFGGPSCSTDGGDRVGKGAAGSHYCVCHNKTTSDNNNDSNNNSNEQDLAKNLSILEKLAPAA